MDATAGWPDVLAFGVAGAALDGEDRSGDLAVFAPPSAGGLVCLIDGLGHGAAAADPAEAAAEAIRHHAEGPPQELPDRRPEALKETRGVGMTLAGFDLGARSLEWTRRRHGDAPPRPPW